jgi:hypothetical protein
MLMPVDEEENACLVQEYLEIVSIHSIWGQIDDEIFERYRFRRPTLIFLCDLIADAVAHPTGRSMSLPPMLQLLVFFRFVATGAFH